jgi:hypothetical protein
MSHALILHSDLETFLSLKYCGSSWRESKHRFILSSEAKLESGGVTKLEPAFWWWLTYLTNDYLTSSQWDRGDVSLLPGLTPPTYPPLASDPSNRHICRHN